MAINSETLTPPQMVTLRTMLPVTVADILGMASARRWRLE
jgi:hypothetical protein